MKAAYKGALALLLVAGLAAGSTAKPKPKKPSKPLASPPPPAPPPAPPPPPAPIPVPPPSGLPTDASPAEWVQLVDEPGLDVRTPSRAWTTAAVRAVIRQLASAAQLVGGKVRVADVGPAAGPGTPYSPHKSHRWGRDLDIGYTFDSYPTPAATPVDPRIPAILETIAPWIDRVGVNASRAPAFAGATYKVSSWPGHVGHLHLRLLRNLTTEPVALLLLPENPESGDYSETGEYTS